MRPLRTTRPLPKAVSLVAGMFLAIVAQTNGALLSAASPSLLDVASAIASASDGDTVIVPAGTASWTSVLFITKGITLQGQTSIAGAGTSTPTITDSTIILDNVTRTGAPALIIATLTPAQSFRLTGFTFRYGSVATSADNGGVHLVGVCPSARIDHCHFDQLYDNPFIMTHGQIYGVVDHSVLDERPNEQTFQVFDDGWGGLTHGDGSWADNAYFGSEKFLFIEDNTFRNANGYVSVGIDSYGGGRYVARHNYLVDTPIGGHGTESSGRFRGVRAIEVYNNTCVWNLVIPRGQLRSGTMLEFNNVWSGSKNPSGSGNVATTLTCYREFWPFGLWGGANGNNPLDSNDSHGLYHSGSATSNSVANSTNSAATVTDTNANFGGTNNLVGYSITNTTQTLSNGFHPSSYITANTSDTITFVINNSFGPYMNFNRGDGYAIYKLLIALDQPGRGKGDLLTDSDPVATGAWPHQALEPVYAWGNTYNNLQQLNLGSGYPTIQENREFYNQKTPFDGTAGVGVGPLADRPKTCTPGVGYWATDQGSQGTLYQCTATNTWTQYYQPYIYPHPLVSDVLAPPSNLRILQ